RRRCVQRRAAGQSSIHVAIGDDALVLLKVSEVVGGKRKSGFVVLHTAEEIDSPFVSVRLEAVGAEGEILCGASHQHTTAEKRIVLTARQFDVELMRAVDRASLALLRLSR